MENQNDAQAPPGEFAGDMRTLRIQADTYDLLTRFKDPGESWDTFLWRVGVIPLRVDSAGTRSRAGRPRGPMQPAKEAASV